MRLSAFYYAIFLAICFFYLSCANIVPPSGGPKDTQPPVVKKESPENYSVNFDARKIIISFDEYAVLKDPAAKIIISPPVGEFPSMHMRGKELIINLKGSLDSNTTYTINFGEALVDLNEGNVLQNFQYVFSTGSYLDSLSVKGYVKNAEDIQPSEGVLVMLYQDRSDSVPYKQKPYYFTKSQKDGTFEINNVKAGEYKLFALKDGNFDYLYNLEQEEIAFYENILSISSDTAISISLVLFKEDNARLKFYDFKTPFPGLIQFIYSKPVDHIDIQLLEPTENYQDRMMEYGSKKDTVNLWYTFTQSKHQQLLLITNDTIFDTLSVNNESITIDSIQSVPAFKTNFSDKTGTDFIDIHNPIQVLFNRPVKSFIIDSLQLFEDSTMNPVVPRVAFSDSIHRHLEIFYPWKENMDYLLYIPDSTFWDYYGLGNNKIKASFHSRSQADYAQLILSMKIDSAGTDRLVQLLNSNSDLLKEKIIKGSGDFKIEYPNLLPGVYSLKVIMDENGNGKWDTGNYLKKKQPEKIYLYPDKINLRANWETEIEVTLTD